MMMSKKLMPLCRACYQHITNRCYQVHGTMDAWQVQQYGPNEVLELCNTAETPMVCEPYSAVVEIHGASVNPIDVAMRGGYGSTLLNALRKIKGLHSTGSEFPLILGRDCSGVVMETGKGVKYFKPGDHVWATPGAFRQGTHSQYVACGESEMSFKPESLSHTEAACLPYVATTVWNALCTIGGLNEKNTLGKRVLIPAGSGGIGSFAIQLMKSWGGHVTSTCSTDAVPLVTSLGTDCVLDYKTEDVATLLQQSDRFDVVLDSLGGEFTQYAKKTLKKNSCAKYITITTPLLGNMDEMGLLLGLLRSSGSLACSTLDRLLAGQFYSWAFFQPNANALNTVARLVDSGKITPVIDEIFPFDQVPEAFDKVAQGHARGKVVINMTNRQTPPHS